MLAAFSAQFTWLDWLVVIAYLGFTTWLGAKMAGKQASIRDFFLGGRKLPWPAVSGSIIASEISALTFVSVPWVVLQPGGNLTYLQLGVFGSFLARIIVGYWLVPAYYKREIYSPFDYMHNQLGGRIRGLTTVLFVIKALLAQSARIYLAAEVIVVVLNDQLVWLTRQLGLNELAWAILIISAVSISWTLLGGMRTVIWTDVALFACFTIGALVALLTVAHAVPGGLPEIFRIGWDARWSGFPQYDLPLKLSGPWGKFTFFDWSTSPTRDFTIWTAIIASTWGGIGSYGLDQTLAQRIFCCRTTRAARRAIITSQVSVLVTVVVALVGVGLYAYYQTHPLTGQALELFQAKGDRILPIFVVEVVPLGLKGMIIAAVFAAAISTMMGVLTATSQTSLTAFYLPLRQWQLRRQRRTVAVHVASAGGAPPESEPSDVPDQPTPESEDRRAVRVSRLLVLFWGAALALLSYEMLQISREYASVLQLGLAMASYILGALLAGFLLSFFPLRIDSRGFMYAAPLSCICVFALIWHQPWTNTICWAAAAIILITWCAHLYFEHLSLRKNGPRSRPPLVLPAPTQTLLLLAGLTFMLWLNYFAYWTVTDPAGNPQILAVAWPWMIPLGTTVAFVWGLLLSRSRP